MAEGQFKERNMSSLFSKPKTPDTSKQEEALARQRRESEDREERQARLGRVAAGRQSLIRTSGTGAADTQTG
jgi:hypothetical protein